MWKGMGQDADSSEWALQAGGRTAAVTHSTTSCKWRHPLSQKDPKLCLFKVVVVVQRPRVLCRMLQCCMKTLDACHECPLSDMCQQLLGTQASQTNQPATIARVAQINHNAPWSGVCKPLCHFTRLSYTYVAYALCRHALSVQLDGRDSFNPRKLSTRHYIRLVGVASLGPRICPQTALITKGILPTSSRHR